MTGQRVMLSLMAGLLVLAACAPDDEPAVVEEPDVAEEPGVGEEPEAPDEPVPDGDWPGDTLEIVVSAAPGGAQDVLVRQIQPFLEEELGTRLELTYQPGGGTAIGAGVVHNQGQECDPVLFTFVPGLLLGYLTQNVHYTYDDFQPVAALSIEYTSLLVRDDAPWDTIDDLIADASARPGEITVSVPFLTSSANTSIVALGDAVGVEFNIIPYGGGGPARTALLGGEVDATIATVTGGFSISDEARFLAVWVDGDNPQPDLTDNAPAVDQAFGTDFGQLGDGFGWFVTTACAEEFPERVERLEAAIEATVANEDYRATLGEEVNPFIQYVPSEDYDRFNRSQLTISEDLLERFPGAFAG